MCSEPTPRTSTHTRSSVGPLQSRVGRACRASGRDADTPVDGLRRVTAHTQPAAGNLSARAHVEGVVVQRAHHHHSSVRPSASGPPRCGHTASIARREPSRIRYTATCSSSTAKVRPSPREPRRASRLPLPSSSHRHLGQWQQRQRGPELALGHRRAAVEPRITVSGNRFRHMGVQLLGNALGVVENHGADLLDSRPGAPTRRCVPASSRSPGSTAGIARSG